MRQKVNGQLHLCIIYINIYIYTINEQVQAQAAFQ